jgi:hypothetical protein
MHAIAALLITEHLNDLRREAEAERTRKALRGLDDRSSSIRVTIAAALRRLAGALDGQPAAQPADAQPFAA